MDEAGLADTADTAAAAAATAVPEESTAAAPKAKKQAPEARAEPKPDPLFFAGLLRTQRLLEKNARAAKISNLSII